MSELRVLFVNPNPRKMSLLPPVVSTFYAIFKAHGIEMRYFDTTFYDVSDTYTDTDRQKAASLFVKSFSHDLISEDGKPRMGHTELARDWLETIQTFKPHVIMASAVESTVSFARELLSLSRPFGIPQLLGGVFATFAPEEAIGFPECDAICIGEGEEIIVPLVEKLACGDTIAGMPNMWVRGADGSIVRGVRQAPVEMSIIPPFTMEPYDDSRCYRAMAGKMYRMFPVETHRGCPQRCTFCNSPLQEDLYRAETGKRYFRKRPIPDVMRDIRYFVNECKAEYLFFWADNFFAYSKKEIDEFAEAYAEFRTPFYCQSYPATLEGHKVSALSKVGLHRVGLGVEHGNEVFRRDVIHRTYSNSLAIERVGILRKYDIQYSCNNIVGFPTETPELHWDTVHLNRALQPHTASCSIFTPFKGTPLRSLALKMGYLKDPDLLAPTNNDFSVLDMPQFPPDQIAGKSRTFNLYLKLPERRWKDVERAEAMNEEGNRIWLELKSEAEAMAA